MTDLLKKAEESAITKKYQQEAPAVIEHAEKIKILTDGDMEPVAGFLAEIDQREKAIKGELDPIIADAHSVHKRLTSLKNTMLAPYLEAKRIAKSKVSAYLEEQDRKRREEQAKLERERLEAERKERERLDRLAEKQMEKGQFEKAEETIERSESVFFQPAVVPEITRSIKTEKGGMTSVRDIEILAIDDMKFLAGIINGTAPKGAATINWNFVKKWMKDYQIDPKQAEMVGIRFRETLGVRRTA